MYYTVVIEYEDRLLILWVKSDGDSEVTLKTVKELSNYFYDLFE